MGHLRKANLAPLWLVLEDKTVEGRKTCNDCFGSQASGADLHDVKTGSPYNEECFETRRKSERNRASRMVKELQKLGYFVVATD